MSKSHLPPIPPASRTDKAGGSARDDQDGKLAEADSRHRNLAEQGRQGNIKQNTTNKGYQQDR